MALQYRKKVRDSILTLLTASFNSTLGTLAATYGITPFTIDFSSSSVNFAVSHIDPADIENCQFETYPAACLYTTEAINTGDPKQWNFSGKVMANLDFYVRDRNGAEGFDTESYFDAIEDSVLSILQNESNQWPGGVIYTRSLEMGREYLIPLGDGFATRIPIKALFEVYVQ